MGGDARAGGGAGGRSGGDGGGGGVMRRRALLTRRFLPGGNAGAVLEAMRPQLARYRWRFAAVAALLPVSAGLAALLPFLIKVAVDDHVLPAVATGAIEPHRGPLLALAGLAAAVVAAGYLADALYVRILQHAGHRLLAALRETVYRRTLRLPRAYFDRNPIGSVLTRVTSDVEALGESLAGHAFSLVADLLKTAAFLGMMFWLSWEATLVLLVMLPALAFVMRFFQRRVRSSFLWARQALSQATGYLQECLAGVKTVQLYAAEAKVLAAFEGRNLRFYRAQNTSNFYDAILYSLVEGLTSLGLAVVLWYSAGALLAGVMTIGVLIAFMEYIQRLFVPVRELAQQLAVLQRALAALDHIGGLLAEPLDPAEPRAPDGEPWEPGRREPPEPVRRGPPAAGRSARADAPRPRPGDRAEHGGTEGRPAPAPGKDRGRGPPERRGHGRGGSRRGREDDACGWRGKPEAPRANGAGDSDARSAGAGAGASVGVGAGAAARFEGLDFERVRFRYSRYAPDVLRGVDLRVRRGETVAIVGATGSGKSSIARLIARAYGGYEGSIRLNGDEIASFDADEIGRLVAVVHQDVFLFHGSIEFNITLGRLDRAAAERAAREVRADEFVRDLPGGYGFEVAHGGANLSAGQAQLVSFARAVAADADLVVLDEATSSVDSMTEDLIETALARLYETRTVIAIAHRLSTIRRADRIVVLDAGEVAETGAHAELVRLGGAYARLLGDRAADGALPEDGGARGQDGS